MLKSGLVSVIMAAYNEELRWVRESVESILNQSYEDFEFIIVLDNPEHLELKELLFWYASKDNRIRLIINSENLGESKSFNLAFSLCGGEYLMLMHADDVSEKNRIEKQKAYLEEKNLDFVVSGLTTIDENSEIIQEGDNTEISNEIFKKFIGIGICIVPPSWFMLPKVFRELEGLRDVPYCPDYDFLLRCIDTNYRLGKMGTSVVKYRIRSTSGSRMNSLEQFLNSEGIRKLYKSGKLENIELVNRMTKNSKDMVSEKNVDNFRKANDIKDMAAKHWRLNNKIRSFYYVVSSSLVCKQYVKMYKRIIRNKVVRKIYL